MKPPESSAHNFEAATTVHQVHDGAAVTHISLYTVGASPKLYKITLPPEKKKKKKKKSKFQRGHANRPSLSS